MMMMMMMMIPRATLSLLHRKHHIFKFHQFLITYTNNKYSTDKYSTETYSRLLLRETLNANVLATSSSTRVSSGKSTVLIFIDVIKNIIRSIQLTIIFTPLALLYPVSYVAPSAYYRYLTATLEFAGPTFVKLGQWASTRRDIFPAEMCASLFRLHSKTSIGEHVKKIPEYVSSRYHVKSPAIGSGCIARVYEGVDRNSGRRVAIKIKHPNVNESVYRDVRILELVAYVFSKIPTMKWLSLYESAREFSVYMKSQLDLNTEASNLKSFRTLFQDVKDVQFPSVVEHDENVLIMDFVNGSCLSELMKSSGNEKLKRSIARLGLKSFLKMLLKDNMIHGDLHPGNIMYNEQGSITFLDVGLTVQLEREDRDNFLDLFRVVLRGQGREAGRLILERSKENNCEDPELFYDEMESIVNDALSQDGGLRDVRSCSLSFSLSLSV